MTKGGFIYIMTNAHHNVLYVGVTAKLAQRIHEHKTHLYKNSFTDKYNIEYLVHFESYPTIEQAIAREKEIKKWGKRKKEALINTQNPDWQDLSDGLL